MGPQWDPIKKPLLSMAPRSIQLPGSWLTSARPRTTKLGTAPPASYWSQVPNHGPTIKADRRSKQTLAWVWWSEGLAYLMTKLFDTFCETEIIIKTYQTWQSDKCCICVFALYFSVWTCLDQRDCARWVAEGSEELPRRRPCGSPNHQGLGMAAGGFRKWQDLWHITMMYW